MSQATFRMSPISNTTMLTTEEDPCSQGPDILAARCKHNKHVNKFYDMLETDECYRGKK